MDNIRQSSGHRRLDKSGLRPWRQFFRQRGSIRRRRGRTDHGRGIQAPGLAPRILSRVHQDILGSRRRSQREKYAEPQAPHGRDRRMPRPSGNGLRRPFILPPAGPRDAHRGNRVGHERHRGFGPRPVLGNQRVERRGISPGLGNRRPPQPAQARHGAAAVQPVRARPGRKPVCPPLRRHGPRPYHLQPAGVRRAFGQICQRDTRGLPAIP